jgi:aminodeoxyfutalosine synthase
MTPTPHDVAALAEALAAGAALSDDQLTALAVSTDILTLAMVADDVRRRHHGSTVTYVRVADVDLGSAVVVPWSSAARELRCVGLAGVDGGCLASLQAVVDMAGSVPVTAFSLAELERAALTSGRSLGDVCRAIRACGVAAIAEVPLDELADPVAACGAVRTAGLDMPRVTVSRSMDAAGWLDVLRRLRQVQTEVGGVRSFAPLARCWDAASPSTGFEDVRRVALARLYVTDLPDIQVDWTLYGPKLAQVALTMGANDLDGVSASDDAPDGHRRAPLEDVLRNIRAAAFTPAERDGRHRRVGV